jgi:mRNA interferase MazF
MGQLDKSDKDGINTRLKYFLGLDCAPDDDWFKSKADPKIIHKLYGYLDESQKDALLEKLIDSR